MIEIFRSEIATIEGEKSAIELFLASGRARDWAEYRHLTGKYEALCVLEDRLKESEKRYIEE